MFIEMRMNSVPSDGTPVQIQPLTYALRPSQRPRKRASDRREHVRLLLPALVGEGQPMECLLASRKVHETRETDVLGQR